MIRGDTKTIKWQIKTSNDSDELWSPDVELDKVYFTVKSDFDSPVALQKVYPDNIKFDKATKYFSTTIFPKDTNKLRFGNYVYDIEVVLNANSSRGRVVKTVTTGVLQIEKEVTTRKDEV